MDYFIKPVDIEIERSVPPSDNVIEFLNKIEGWKTRCKNLHWSAPKKNVHEYLDEFYAELMMFQDELAEGYMGMEGKLQPNALKGTPCEVLNANDLLVEVKLGVTEFYESLPQEISYKGIASECESFIQTVHKYRYLIGLCDVRLY